MVLDYNLTLGDLVSLPLRSVMLFLKCGRRVQWTEVAEQQHCATRL